MATDPTTATPLDPAAEALGSPDWDALAAQSTVSAIEFLSTVEEANQYGVNTVWGMPKELVDQGWRVVRLNMAMQVHQATYHQLRRMGYQDAPPGVRMLGYTDHPEVKYLVAAPAVVRMLNDLRKQKQRQVATGLRDVVQQHASALRAMLPGSARVEVTHQDSGTGTAAEVDAQIQKAAAAGKARTKRR